MVWASPTRESAVMFLDRIRRLADRPYPGRVELAALAVLYGAYELVRGFGTEDWVAARAHTADIVGLERHLNLFIEQDVQDLAGLLPGVPALLGLLYVALHFGMSCGHRTTSVARCDVVDAPDVFGDGLEVRPPSSAVKTSVPSWKY